MIDPDSAPLDVQTEPRERHITPSEAVDTSNRKVIIAIYAAANESPPTTLMQETNGSKSYIDHAGLIRLVYAGERQEAEDNPQSLPVNPAVDKLSELVTVGKVLHRRVPETHRGFRPANDPIYKAIDKAWGDVYSFTDAKSGEVLCYSVKADTHSRAETVLISPEHVDLTRSDINEGLGAVVLDESISIE